MKKWKIKKNYEELEKIKNENKTIIEEHKKNEKLKK